MRSASRWVVIVIMGLSAALAGADLAGTWQGTLNVGRELRLVFTVAPGSGGAVTGTMRSLDQGGQAFAVSEVSLQGGTVRMAIPGIGGTFEGRLSQDEKTVAGTWSQAGMSWPLTLARVTADTAWAIPSPPASLAPMAPNAPLTFEVATIKPSRPEAQGRGILMKGRQLTTLNTSLGDLITFANDLHARQLAGGPAWLDTNHFDITAQPEAQGQPNIVQLKAMVKQLLADRFKLTTHAETRELAVYAIVTNAGHKLTRSAGDPNGLPSLLFRGLGVLPVMNATMADFAGVMQNAVLDRPVVDRTGLAGRWDFTLTWTPDESQFKGLGVRVPPPPADGSGPPGLFTAVQEQLGLRFDAAKATVPVLVIDRAEPPSEN